MHHLLSRGRAAATLAFVVSVGATGHAAAQAATAAALPASAASAASAPRATTLAPVVVTGNPLGSRDLVAPVTVLSGDELVLRRGSSLGETLAGQPGVSSTYFGPNANRPVIRGFDGDRVRVLSNSGASLDASSLSFDHAVPIDPLVVERVEVLRGPAALQYGGSAIGGVVNAIDNRIPRTPLTAIGGDSEVRLGGADHERGGSALVEAGNGTVAFHVDAFGRETDDLSVPRYRPVEADGTVLAPTTRIRNSASRSDGGSVGASWTFGSGYIGLSADSYRNVYGATAEPDVSIHMKRDHVALSGEWRDLGGPVRTVRFQLNDTRYQHQEIEGDGAVGTTFRTSGPEARVEFEHAPIGPLKGVVGLQYENVAFSALGDEAFVPTTKTRRESAFVVEEAATPLGTATGGLRIERARVASDGDTDASDDRFGPATSRSFSLVSASLGHVFKLGADWSVAANASSTGRAPTSFELYAHGVHAATGAYERGDATLSAERGRNVDVALQWKTAASSARVGVFAARFSRFISLEATGASVTADGDGGPEAFPEYAFKAVRASFDGVEAEAKHRLLDGAWTLDLSAKGDYVRATDRDTGEPLPRIAPLRGTLGVDAGTGPWLGRVEWELAARQDRYADTDRPTAGWGIVNLALTRKATLGGVDAFWFVKATNLGDKLAYNAATVDTIRGLVPLAGRAVKVGVHVAF